MRRCRRIIFVIVGVLEGLGSFSIPNFILLCLQIMERDGFSRLLGPLQSNQVPIQLTVTDFLLNSVR